MWKDMKRRNGEKEKRRRKTRKKENKEREKGYRKEGQGKGDMWRGMKRGNEEEK